jgi:site-specific DNA-methyltransferase (adenine-specific)
MGKAWDTGERAFSAEFWREALRVTKPGGHVAAFGGTRTYHRLACAIEDAGAEIREQLLWLYASGFPKSHDVSASGRAGAEAWAGWGTALKPAAECIALARKPLIGTVADNVLAHGTGAIHVAACRVGDAVLGEQRGGQSRMGTFVRSMRDGTGVIPERIGRWPANVLHDGSAEVVACFPRTEASSARARHNGAFESVAKGRESPDVTHGHDDSGGSAARFFFCAKAGAEDRCGSRHPTVKPVALMRWLCRLITPPGGLILDPFAGTGTTGQAAFYEGFSAVLMEREPDYRADIARRMALTMAGAAERRREIAKARPAPAGPMPLFEGAER